MGQPVVVVVTWLGSWSMAISLGTAVINPFENAIAGTRVVHGPVGDGIPVLSIPNALAFTSSFGSKP